MTINDKLLCLFGIHFVFVLVQIIWRHWATKASSSQRRGGERADLGRSDREQTEDQDGEDKDDCDCGSALPIELFGVGPAAQARS